MNNTQISRYYILAAFVVIYLCFYPFKSYCQSGSDKVESLKLAIKHAKTDTDKVKSLIELSKFIDCSDSTNKALYAKEASKLAEKIQWERGIILADRTLGLLYEDCIGDHTKSINYFKKARNLASKSGDRLNEAMANNSIANTYKKMAQYSKALDYYRDVLSLKSNANIELGVLGNMGVVYTNIGDYPRALACYDSSMKILNDFIRAKKVADFSDSLQMAGLLFTIGDIYLAMKQFDKALGNYNNALLLCEKTNQRSFAMYALTGIAKAYKHQNNFIKAIEYYNKALDNSKEENNITEKAGILNQIANVYLEKGDVNIAMEYAAHATELIGNDDKMLPENYITIGKIHTLLKNYNRAVEYLTSAIALCEKAELLDMEKDALQALSFTYEQMKQPALALDAFKQFISIRDSLFNVGKANEITRIDLQSGYERRQVEDSVKHAGAYELNMQKQKIYTYSGFAGLAMVLAVSFFIYRGYHQQKKANQVIRRAHEKIQDEKVVSDQLLRNILPEEVARELKTSGSVEAKEYDNVTVIFTDFINFTGAAERFTPQDLVAELHSCFMAFDRIMSMYHIEKIKTIGDAYMAVAGLPHPNANHAATMIQAAFEIRDYMAARKAQLGDRTFDIRIGLNSGGVVAGIVGANKFAYDIWGDTVNIAARMEQYGVEGKINISQTTFELVKNKFTFTDRGEIDAKHKGKMRMYFVEV